MSNDQTQSDNTLLRLEKRLELMQKVLDGPAPTAKHFAKRIQLNPEYLAVLMDEKRKDQRGRFLHNHKGRPRRRR